MTRKLFKPSASLIQGLIPIMRMYVNRYVTVDHVTAHGAYVSEFGVYIHPDHLL